MCEEDLVSDEMVLLTEHELQVMLATQDIGSSSNNDVKCVNECDYNDAGWCLLHKRFGERVLSRSKKCKVLENGLCGYKLTVKKSWRCGGLSLNSVGDSESSGGDKQESTSLQVGVRIGGFTLDNLSVLGGGLCEKRLADSSLEPRKQRKKARCEGVFD